MSERKEKLIARLSDSREYLNKVLDQVGDRWEEKVYSDGLAWTVRQLVNHLADADRGHNNQVMNIAEGRDIIPEDFDIERYNRRVTEKAAEKTVESARYELNQSRQMLNDWLFALNESKLDAKGRHATLRIMSVEEILYQQATHEEGHARDIAEAVNDHPIYRVACKSPC
jgi:hypothetical protein